MMMMISMKYVFSAHFPMLAFDCKQVRQASSNLPDKCSLQACRKCTLKHIKVNASFKTAGVTIL